MSDKEAVKLLATVPLFSECTKRELQSIAATAKEVDRKEGAVLVKEGDRGIGFFLIIEGRAGVTVGKKKVRSLGPGEFFGEISLLDDSPRSATVVAETPVRMLGLTSWAFKRLIQDNPAIAPRLLKSIASRIRADASNNVR